MVCGLVGSWQIEEIARLANLSFTLTQLFSVERKLVHFQIPPATPDAERRCNPGRSKTAAAQHSPRGPPPGETRRRERSQTGPRSIPKSIAKRPPLAGRRGNQFGEAFVHERCGREQGGVVYREFKWRIPVRGQQESMPRSVCPPLSAPAACVRGQQESMPRSVG